MDEDGLLQEYYEISKIVNEFDKRLLTVKGWGVTLALAALAWGFKDNHFGLFLVAALSGLSFWLIEGTMKRHQMRYYFRMREIEVLRYGQAVDQKAKEASSPRIDSSWSHAGWVYSGKDATVYHPEESKGPCRSYKFAWFFPHVMLPHVVSVIAGIVLLVLGYYEIIAPSQW